jgi:hypothetical protein
VLCRHPAKADAPCVAALKELGAVLLGKGAMVEFGIFSHGHNPHFGATLNPHHPSRTAGGSSSGAAAAVATGICPIAIGTDGGGSIRVPASYCGVVGMKPTAGRLADDHCEYPARWHKLSVYRPLVGWLGTNGMHRHIKVQGSVVWWSLHTMRAAQCCGCAGGCEHGCPAAGICEGVQEVHSLLIIMVPALFTNAFQHWTATEEHVLSATSALVQCNTLVCQHSTPCFEMCVLPWPQVLTTVPTAA